MMPTMSLVVGYLRKHCEPCGFEQLTQEVCGLFPSPGKGLLNAEFYVADARKRYYFEFIEAAAGASGAGQGGAEGGHGAEESDVWWASTATISGVGGCSAA